MITGWLTLGLTALMAAGAYPSHQDSGSSPAAKPHPPRAVRVSPSETPASRPAAPTVKADRNFGNLPLSFEPNHGQTDPRVKFLSRGRGYTLFLTGDEAVLSLGSASQTSTGEGQRAQRENPETRNWKLETGNWRFGNRKSAIDNRQSVPQSGNNSPAPSTQHPEPSVLRLKLVGADPNAEITGLDELPGKSNYFIGNDPEKWRTNVPNFAKVRYKDVWPGIDLVYYGKESGVRSKKSGGKKAGGVTGRTELEFDFVVAPGADPRTIRFAIETGNSKRETGNWKLDAGESKIQNLKSKVAIAANGDLVIATEAGEVRFRKPVVYQEQSTVDSRQLIVRSRQPSAVSGQPQRTTDNGPGTADNRQSSIGNRQFLGGRYVVRPAKLEAGNSKLANPESRTPNPVYEVGFELASYNPALPLVIDPVLSYSTYLGGSDEDIAYGIAVGADGNVYLAGSTGSTDFPTATPYQDANHGLADVFVAKLNPEGKALVYSTYLGGTGFDRAKRIALDSSGSVYVTGSTASSNFPTTAGALQTTFGDGTCGTAACSDAFVTKLDAAGAALTYSTYLGGTGADVAEGIALDSSGAAYVVGSTESADFPTVAALQTASGGGIDAFVAKVNASGGALVYSTYLGGGDADFGQGIAVDASGSAAVTGFTFSINFPTASALQAESAGSIEAFVTKFDASGAALLYSTYLGGSGMDRGSEIALDSSGNAYVTGDTDSADDFPTTTGAFQTTYGGNGDAFVTKLNAAGSAHDYSTFLGGIDAEEGLGLAIEESGAATVVGFTRSGDYPTANAVQAVFGGGMCGTLVCPDAFVTRLDSTGTGLVYSTYLGGELEDFGQAVAVDSAGNAFVTGSTASADFPVSMGVLQIARGGTGPIEDAFVAKLSPLNAAGLALAPQSLTFADQPTGFPSDAQTITLTNTGSEPLTISSIATTGDFARTNDNENDCGEVLAAGGARCTISVTFTPTETGDRTGELTITSSAGDSPHVLALTGKGITPIPAVTLDPATLTFAGQTADTTSDPQTVTLTNSGFADLTITSADLTGSNAGDFAKSADTCTGATVAPNGTCIVSVTFTPTATGDRSAGIDVTDNATGSPHKVTLTGTGVAVFALSATASSVIVTRGTDSTTYEITASAPSEFTLSISLACADNQQATCTFNPTSVTAGQNSTLTLGNLDQVAAASLAFKVNGTSGTQTATVSLTLDFADFTVAADPAFASISAGETATYQITLTPTHGFTGTATFACGTLPRESTCTFTPTSVTLDGTTPATTELEVQTTQRSQVPPVNRRAPRTPPLGFFLAATLLAALMGTARWFKRHLPRFVAPVAAIVLLGLLAASCGTEYRTVRGTLSGSYSIPVTATSGEAVHSTLVVLTVN